MTAEIAIINRSAVTLATDSAVTLSVHGQDKIYNCADKLFELSDQDPIGIMVYNNLEYMGIPFEVAIKKFRHQFANDHYVSVEAAAEAFFKYLQHDLAPDPELQLKHARMHFDDLLDSLKRAFQRSAVAAYRENRQEADLKALFSSIVEEKIDEFEALCVAECLEDISEDDVMAFYAETIDASIAQVIDGAALDEGSRSNLRRVCVLSLMRDTYSEFLTGVVFAGFGEHEMFPALVAFELDGVVAGRLKRRKTDAVKTSRSEVMGEILPFAQREMVDRFLYGIDPRFETGIERFLRGTIEMAAEAVVTALAKPTKATKGSLTAAIKVASETALKSWREKMVPLVKKRFMQEVQDMVYLMPKQELASLAEELINLTSVKRKFSSERESVGGPIDVAVISRIDGFVWVRRKHYFEPSLNPRYFHKKFGRIQL